MFNELSIRISEVTEELKTVEAGSEKEKELQELLADLKKQQKFIDEL